MRNHGLQCFAGIVIALSLGTEARAVTIVSQGYVVPETISQAPAAFGTYGGQFFIPDFRTDQIMLMPAGFGDPTVFQSATQDITGGLFLPAGFGSASGKFIVVGRRFDTATGQITAYDSNGGGVVFGSSPVVAGLSDPAIAPAGFGSHGGELFVSEGSGVAIFDGTGAYSSFVPQLFSGNAAFGLAFAPIGFGSVGGQLLVSNGGQVNGESEILALDSSGNVSPFADIKLSATQVGLRQMAFAPDDFGPYGGMLFVSVADSPQGGGALGAVLVLDDSGSIVATLKLGTEFDKFDPRGLLFLDGQLLISDASDPIALATAADFTATPLPGSIVMLGLTALTWLGVGRLRSRHADGVS